ncbi:Protein of unknown function (DUF1635 [Striga hermonthica]|uniref:Uncharacterized protein n=1 Tax=Striga hermonthica TaxID=68872 RepID=A0A9N7MV22_STRHE|nr:Protein of unknown function (DUF1635 [Striga hermonthica]
MEQLEQKLLYTTLELEKLKSEAENETRKNKEYIRQLIHLLRYALHERDEAKKQLHDLRSALLVGPHTASKANSSITESNSLGYSPIEEFPSPVVHDADISAVVLNGNPPVLAGPGPGPDPVDLGGRALPQRGKFLDAVLRAGPLLQTLLVAGPLPRWRNPPQYQMMQLPLPLAVEGLTYRPGPNPGPDRCSVGMNGLMMGYAATPLANGQRANGQRFG